jgi:long-chain acyl-CoA synthetase
VHQGYGLTEAAPVVTSTLCSATVKPGSVGAALPGVRVRLRDDEGREPEGEDPGEIQVSGDNLFDGYWPDASDGPVDGWLATRDIGFLDEDGDLFLVDRVDDVVVVSGFHVYPTEVEEVLAEVSGVAEAAVVGEPDTVTGETVVAFVRAEPDTDPDLLVARVNAHCAVRLARFKRPTSVHVVAALPHTVTGKLSKGRLRATVRRRNLGLLE